jgi:hypothetical protein
LIAGKVAVRPLVEVLARRAGSLAVRRGRDALRALGRSLPEDLGAELQKVAHRRVPVHFLFATGDPGRELLSLQAGSALAPLLRRGAITIDEIDGPDHTFTPLWSHPLLIDRVSALVDRHLR